MKNSLQAKLFTLSILLIIITSTCISIPFYYYTKHENQMESQIRIHVAFEIIRNDILDRIKNYSIQIEELVNQVSAIPWGLKWYSDIANKGSFFASSTYSSYIITIGQEFHRFSHLVPADRLSLYGLDKRLLVSYQHLDGKDEVGTYIVSRDGKNYYLTIENYSQFLIKQKGFFQSSFPKGVKAEYGAAFPKTLTSQHFIEDGKLGLRIVTPITQRKEVVGILVAESFYTQDRVEEYSELSKTHVNIFVDDVFSIGTLPQQGQLQAQNSNRQITHNELIQLGKDTQTYSETIGGVDFYQGKYDFVNGDGIPIASITANLSKESEIAESRNLLLAVISITLLAILISFSIVVLFSRNTIIFIQKLTETTSAIANGNLQEPIDIRRKDELGILASSFFKMQQAIQKQLTELNNEILERKQAEQTIKEREKEKASLEKQLYQSQKMEAIGTLAGGIAHDFNNILTVILGYSELLKNRYAADEQLSGSIGKIVTAGNRAKNLVTQILAFSRKDSKVLIPIRPDLIANEALELLRASIPATVNIRKDIQKCDSIVADPTQLHQVIMNLCTNAYHSMRETGGEIVVLLQAVQLEEKEIAELSLSLSPGAYVKLQVSDTGHGMERDTQQKIFEPYFTTKEKGDGTGLGLAVVHGVVTSFGGKISVTSVKDEGTTFTIYFPRITGEIVHSQEKANKPVPTGSEHILLVDDETPILDLEEEMLTSLGYRVTKCNTSLEALRVFQSRKEEFSLIITDMTMPDMNGIELIGEIWRVKSDIPIILCSGFNELIDEKKAKDMGIHKYLMKPVQLQELAEAVRESLDKS